MSELVITDVDTHVVGNPWKPWVFVRVHTDAGITGVGEATLPRKPETVTTAIKETSSRYVGQDPFETERFFLTMYRSEGGMMPHRVNMAVISAMDIACWDIKGKYLDTPVAELLGGSVQGDVIRGYANGWYVGLDDEPEDFARAAAGVVEDGYDAMKFDPFGSAWMTMTSRETNHALDIVKAVREAVGPAVDLIIEAHYRFSAGQAIDLAEKLAPYDITWLEQPTPPDNLDALRRVTQHSSIPIAVDRTPEARPDAALFTSGIDVIQPDPLYTGGITGGKKITGQAEAEHVNVAPHNANGPISTAACAHLDATTSHFMIQEVFHDYAYPEWAEELLVDPIEIEDGNVRLPEAPGLGVELDLDVVAEHAYDPEDADQMLDLFEAGWEDRSLT